MQLASSAVYREYIGEDCAEAGTFSWHGVGALQCMLKPGDREVESMALVAQLVQLGLELVLAFCESIGSEELPDLCESEAAALTHNDRSECVEHVGAVLPAESGPADRVDESFALPKVKGRSWDAMSARSSNGTYQRLAAAKKTIGPNCPGSSNALMLVGPMIGKPTPAPIDSATRRRNRRGGYGASCLQ